MARQGPPFHLLLSLFLIILPHFHILQASSNPDTQPLLSFKATADASNRLWDWNTSTAGGVCRWTGVSCFKNRVSRLVLEGFDLHGSFQQLTSLTQLRILSLKRNRFSGPLPDLSNLPLLKLLFLSRNELSGEFPETLTSLLKLYRLDLSHNNFSGEIPASVNNLTSLLTLRLEENGFSGQIPGIDIPNLQDFNVSGNRLVGQIPASLSGHPESAFAHNSLFLCGSPLPKCKDTIQKDPARPGEAMAGSPSPVNPGTAVVASSPSSMPAATDMPMKPGKSRHRSSASKIRKLVIIVAIIIGDILLIVLVSVFVYCYINTRKRSSQILEGEKMVYSSSPYHAISSQSGGGFDRGKMVFFDGAKRFELEDLLRASAEMLGKGGFGTAYKAVLDDGSVVAVKRLKEMVFGGRKEFEQHMEVLGRLRHTNLVNLKAYYFARDEKLLVYDYMPNGSLFWLLHGNRGPGRTPLDWTTRLKIAAGASRGIAFIHNSCKTLKLTHGNIKSTNILIDNVGNARVSDFGLAVFASPPSAAPRPNGYQAPEALAFDGRKITQKSDVYSFGVLLLELLTGKCPAVNEGAIADLPRWVQSVVREEWTAEVFDLELMRYKDIEEEMVGLLQIAMACTSPSPDQRPKIAYVVRMIDELRGFEVSPSQGSVSDSPAVSEDTNCGASH
ncbi:unnamed protein product [Cuscuta epithymum]|uniref:Protein kinase domain-containing protein n=1 Tax=Cuscuta epithymum TaxID=186058 RepID=A0AAV0FEZ1_9ASTE|nr:unnamed protein product [Cuscuta epithymum]